MKNNLLYILTFLMVGCSSNSLVRECEGNMEGSAKSINANTLKELAFMQSEALERRRYLNLYDSAIQLKSHHDSIASTTENNTLKLAKVRFVEKTKLDSILIHFSRNWMCGFDMFRYLTFEYKYPYLIGFIRYEEPKDSIAFNFNQPDNYRLVTEKDTTYEYKLLHYMGRRATYKKHFGLKIPNADNKRVVINYTVRSAEGIKPYLFIFNVSEYAK